MGVNRRTHDLLHLYRGTFRGFKNVFGLPLESMRAPLTRIPLDAVVHTFDFLPDRTTLVREPLAKTPHAAFARGFLANPQFDYRASEYYVRTADGTLAVPSAGVPHAEWRSRNFIYVIRSMTAEGYQPAAHGAINVVQLSDGTLMVMNGKHRAATLVALGARECEAVIWPANEIHATVERQVMALWPQRFYSKQFAALEALGAPGASEDPRVAALVKRIRDARLESWNDVYHPLPFHEFRQLRPMIDGTTAYRRLAMILAQRRDWVGLEVLDLGCNLGFYSFSLARRGAISTGIDIRPEYIEIANELADIYALPARFHASAVTPQRIRDGEGGYDVTICFSMLQWVIEQQGEAFGLEVLKAISDTSRSLFFDVAVNSGRAQLKCRPGEEIGFTYDLLRRGTTYPNIEYIGDVEPWGHPRYVFHCSR